MAQRLSELCRDLLCQTDYSFSNPEKLLLVPLPSTAEKILLSSPRKLPFEMADQLVEDLAKRGKLTSRILRILMESTLTRLNLTCLRSIDDEPTFLSQLANQYHVVDVDLSSARALANCRFHSYAPSRRRVTTHCSLSRQVPYVETLASNI